MIPYRRYALVNYGTGDVAIDEELWFSTNDWLNTTAGAAKQSATNYGTQTLSAESSYRWGKGFRVPTTLSYGTEYHVIVKLNSGSTSEESDQNNWIPMTGMVTVRSLVRCEMNSILRDGQRVMP
jgi:hypothetical protein